MGVIIISLLYNQRKNVDITFESYNYGAYHH